MNIKNIKNPILFLMFLGFILISTPVSLYAATQYVSDNLVIMMRSGEGGDYKILKTLKTGMPLEIIEETEDYYKVQTKDGTEGWVLKRYITVNTPKKIIISGLKRKIQRSKADLEKLKRERAALTEGLKTDKSLYQSDVKKLEKDLKEKNGRIYSINRQLKQMTDKYKNLAKNSANVVKVVSERDKLSKENISLSTENKAMTLKNESLLKKNAIYWFLVGGFVFFFGWIAGQFTKKKRSRY